LTSKIKAINPRRVSLILPSSIFFFVVVTLLTNFIGGKLDMMLHLPAVNLGFIEVIAPLFLLAFGGYYVLESIRVLFVKGGGIPLGDVISSDQSIHLVTEGVYEKTRNPMLFGYLLALCGLGLLAQSPSFSLILPSFYLGLWIFWQKKREEPFLEKRFGEKYLLYINKTPFLLQNHIFSGLINNSAQ
jgi:protein-S-isoprenylcysteine O-methyltransferase Ste14